MLTMLISHALDTSKCFPFFRLLSSFSLGFLMLGCATGTRGKVIQSGIIGAAIGGIYGSSRANMKDQNALMFGALGATIGTTAGLFYYQNEEQVDRLRNENMKLRNSLDDFERRLSEPLSETTISGPESSIPDDYKSLIKPGSVRMYKINKWEREGKNRIVFKSEAIELVEPSFKSGKN